LRERRDDIPLLVRYFVQGFARRMNKHIDTVPVEIMRALQNRDWPGNVRELEHFIERSIRLTEGSTLRDPRAER
jgi:formate hydrogenlyase transcriptional activator